MSNSALLERPAVTAPNRTVRPAEPSAPLAPAGADLPAVRSPPGFALYVGLDEIKAAEAGVSLPLLVDALRRTLAELAPGAETHATVALAPHGSGGRDLDVVRLALQEPGAIARTKAAAEEETTPEESGVTVDISRKRVLIDGESAAFTYKEFELLQYLVLREGRTISREELITGLWSDAPAAEVPSERTIDVHVRRLRVKLAQYQDIVRTVRGTGYRFDRHADVSILHTAAPSPDAF